MVALSPKKLALIAQASVQIFRLLRKLYNVASLSWWVYVVVILTLFFGGMLLNYIIKKINEARLENRFTSLRNKASANQSTQVLKPMEISNRPIPLGNVPENLNKGISMIFNKDENLLEDKRRKDLDPQNSANSHCVITIDASEHITNENSSMHSAKDEDIKTVFLGTIYKELYENRAAIEKSKSLSNADRDSILNEIVDKMVSKINESKSTPSIKKLIDIQNKNDLKDWALDIVKKTDEASASTSEC